MAASCSKTAFVSVEGAIPLGAVGGKLISKSLFVLEVESDTCTTEAGGKDEIDIFFMTAGTGGEAVL